MISQKLESARNLFRLTKLGAERFGLSAPEALKRIVDLFFMRHFSSTEIFGEALMDPKLDATELSRYISKESAWIIYEKMNRCPEQIQIDDKLEFHAQCEHIGVAVPRLIDVFVPNLPPSNRDTRTDWRKKLLTEFPSCFVVKPTLGLKGAGVMIVTREGDAFRTSDSRLLNIDRLLTILSKTGSLPMIHPHYKPYDQRVIFQERLAGHDDLATLSGTDALQCIRVCTALDEKNHPSIVFAFLKIITGKNRFDTFDRGRTGNLLGFISSTTGKIFRVVGTPDQSEIAIPMNHHPDTGTTLVGFEIPQWDAVVELAMRASRAFDPVGFVGWDIAVTDRGPVLIEGNTTWDPVAPFEVPLDQISTWADLRSQLRQD